MSHLWPFFLIAALALAPTAAAQNTLTLHPVARIAEGEAITLADIAAVAGPDAAAIGAIVVPQEAGPGAEEPAAARSWVELDLEAVRAALAAAEFPSGRVAVNGASCAVRFVRPLPDLIDTAPEPAQRSDAGAPTIRDAITAQLVRFYGVPHSDLRLTFRARAESADLLKTPIAGRRIDIQPGAADSSARVPVHVFVFEGDRLAVNETVLVDAVIRRTVLIARRDIDRRETIAADDFIVADQWIAASDRAPATAETATDAQASDRISAGDVITTAHVEPPIVVSRGDIVSVHCLSGAFSIQIRARAMDKGRDGDVVPFRAEGARRGGRDAHTFLARMNGRGTAVMLTSPSPSPAITTTPRSAGD